MFRWVRAFAQTTTCLGVVLIGAIWGGVFLLANAAHQRAYEEGLRQGSNLTRIFEEYISRVVQSSDSQLQFLRKLYEQDPANFDFARWIDSTKKRNDLTNHFSIIDPQGIIKLTSLGPVRSRVDTSQNESFRTHINSTTDDLHISVPRIGRLSGRLSVQLTRRVTKPDGAFGGTISASLDVLQLQQFYDSIDIGYDGIITLVGFDGIIRVRSGSDPAAGNFIGQSAGRTKLFELFRESPQGSYWNSVGNAQQFGGVRRLISYRVVEGLPLIAMVGLAEGDIFEPATSAAQRYDQIGSLFTAIVLIAMGVGAARKRNLSATTAALERSKTSLEQTNLRFDTALKHMSHGLCMFDRDQRLLVSNARYGEMYGLSPEQIKPGTTLRAILEARVAAGSVPADTKNYIGTRLTEVAKSEAHYVVNELRDGRFFC